MDNVRQNGTYHNHHKPSLQTWDKVYPISGTSQNQFTESKELKVLPRVCWVLVYLLIGFGIAYLIG